MAKKDEHGGKVAQQDYSESMNAPLGVTRRYNLTFREGVTNVKTQLERSGFDIVLDFDVKEYLGTKMKNMPNHLILLICNRDMASELIAKDVQASILFPCRVTIKEVMDESVVEVSVEDISVTWSPYLKKSVGGTVKKVQETLIKVLDHIGPMNVKL
jgi:uncharacterized protein (DUF302 family)